MAQLRWQKPANGSDALAIAQIRCSHLLAALDPADEAEAVILLGGTR